VNIEPRLNRIVSAQPYPLIFATISGAHLYGFPSPDSDYDLRGAHMLPLDNVLSLDVRDETMQDSRVMEGLEMDIVTHDARKFIGMLLKKNGYVLEQLLSPLIVLTTPEHEELKALARDCITRHHSHHYLGFAETQWRLFSSEESPRVKPLLYTYRVLLTGIHLMRSGEIEANLLTLNEGFRLPFLQELIAQKLSGPEQASLNDAEISFHEVEVNRLRQELETDYATTRLQELPSEETRSRLSKLLVRLRINPPVRGIH
jgi:uncharacterized protein